MSTSVFEHIRRFISSTRVRLGPRAFLFRLTGQEYCNPGIFNKKTLVFLEILRDEKVKRPPASGHFMNNNIGGLT